MNSNSYIVIVIYGALLLLSFLLFSNPLKVNRKANFWFGIFLLLWSTFWLEEIFELSALQHIHPAIFTGVHFIQFLTPIVFFFSILFYTNPEYIFNKSAIKYGILPLLFLACLLEQQSLNPNEFIAQLMVGLIVSQAVFYTVLSWIKIKQHKKKIQLFSSNTSEIDLQWLEYIILALLVLTIFITFYNIFLSTTYLNLFANTVSIVIIFFIGYNALKQKKIFVLNEQVRNEIIAIDQDSKKKKIISDAKLTDLKAKLLQYMEVEHVYLDGELNLKKLADELNITPHQLSYVINEGFHENFFLFVNKYRVKHAKELLLNKEKNHLSFVGIAFEAGFNSKTSFNTTFKKITNQTPSEFKKRSTLL